MVLEILNIVVFLLYVVVGGFSFSYTKKLLIFLKWKHYFIFILVAALITHNQFFTLTERVDTMATQGVMLKQIDKNKHSKNLDNYLKERENTEIVEEDFEKELLKQQMKSKALAKDIDDRNKGE